MLCKSLNYCNHSVECNAYDNIACVGLDSMHCHGNAWTRRYTQHKWVK